MRSRQARTRASEVVSPDAMRRAASAAEKVLRPLVASAMRAPVASASGEGGAAGRAAGDAPEHRARGQAGAARIVEIEDAADQLAGGVEARDRLVIHVHHLALIGDAQATEGEGDAAGHG